MTPITSVHRQSPRTRISLIHVAVRGALLAAAALPFAAAQAAGSTPAQSQPLLAASAADQQQISTGATGVSGNTNGTTSNSSQETQLQAVVVKGIRESLAQSEAIKELSDQEVDAITAQDLGQFPDSDVAESLSHIPGVAIDRDETGSGSEVTIRGFGPAFNTVLINGQELPTATSSAVTGTGGREFNFDVLPTDQITKSLVYKTAEAWQPDGAIGGLIELETAHPLDFNGFKATAKVQGSETSLDTKVTPNEFVLVSDTFDDNRLGALISFASTDEDTRTRTLSVSGWALPGVTGTALPAPLTPNTLMPVSIDYAVNTYEVKRENVNASLQWKPSDNLKITLDGVYNRYEEFARAQQLGLYFDGNPILANPAPTVGPDGVVQTFTADSHEDAIEGQQGGQVSPQYLRSLNLKIEGSLFDNNLTWALDGSDSRNVADDYTDPNLFTVLGFPLQASFTNTDGTGIPSATTSPSNLIDPGAIKAHYTAVTGSYSQNDIRQLTLDGTLHGSDAWGPVSDLRFGAYGQKNSYDTYSTYNEDSICAYCGYGVSVPGSLVSAFTMPNMGGPYTGTYPSSFLTYNPQAYIAYLDSAAGFAARDAADGLAPGTSAALIGEDNFMPLNPLTNKQAIAQVTEKTYALYLQADFDGTLAEHSWGGNVGVRWVRTEEDAVGYSQVLSDITPIPNDPTGDNAIYADNGATLEVAGSHSYNHLLPSANFRFSLTHQLLLRAAVSESLARPEPALLSPVLNYGGSILAPDNLVATGGNPNLKPYTSRNYDLSLEWYYSRDGYLAASVFRKDLNNFIETVTASTLSVPIVNSQHLSQFPNNVATFQFDGPTNIGQAHVSGVELSAQHMFSYLPAPLDGLGFNANATILSTSAGLNSAGAASSNAETFGLTGLGDYQNVSLIYQKYGVGARLTYDHRNNYITGIGTGGIPLDRVFVKGYGTLDMQINYDVTKNFTVSFSGTNLTDTVIQEYVDRTDEFNSLLNYGRRFTLSGKVTF
jgi:iron complex outermembrane recepter protein